MRGKAWKQSETWLASQVAVSLFVWLTMGCQWIVQRPTVPDTRIGTPGQVVELVVREEALAGRAGGCLLDLDNLHLEPWRFLPRRPWCGTAEQSLTSSIRGQIGLQPERELRNMPCIASMVCSARVSLSWSERDVAIWSGASQIRPDQTAVVCC